MSHEEWQELFPLLADTSGPVAHALHTGMQEVTLAAGAHAFRQGDACQHYLLVIEGSVKVIARGESGGEIVLYRVRRGASCVLTTSCLMSRSRYPAEGIAETPVRALAIPATVFEQALNESAIFRRFVFETYGQRLTEVIRLVEALRFGNVRERLARHLLDRADEHGRLDTTHQALATELGSAREVISRQLKTLADQGLIVVERGRISILRPELLRLLVAPTV